MVTGFLKDFLKSPDWQKMRNALEEAVSAPILWVVSDSGSSMQKADDRYPDLCQLIRESPEGLRRCRNAHRARFREVKRTGKPVVSDCFCGFVGFALPLMLGDEIIGVAGGSHPRTASPMTMEKCAELSTACNVNLKQIMDHAKTTKHMPKVEQKRLLAMLAMSANMFSVLIGCRNEMNAISLMPNLEERCSALLAFINEIAKLAASELDREEMLSIITSRTKSVLNVDACSVYVLDQRHRELVLIATDGLPDRYLGRRIKVGEGITGHVAETREAVAVEDAASDSRFESALGSSATDRKRRWNYKSVLSVPLIARDKLVGVIDVRTAEPRSWLQADTDSLSIIAEQMAGIIRNSKETGE